MAKFLEYQGKEWLAKGGMPVPKGRVASSPEEAEEAARWIGGPVAVKGQVQAGAARPGSSSWPIRPRKRVPSLKKSSPRP